MDFSYALWNLKAIEFSMRNFSDSLVASPRVFSSFSFEANWCDSFFEKESLKEIFFVLEVNWTEIFFVFAFLETYSTISVGVEESGF